MTIRRRGGDQDLDRRILEIFHSRPGAVVSGEELRMQLGISRTAVWKHINNLRRQGVQLVTVPARGYRLATTGDALVQPAIAAGLATVRIGGRILVLAEVGSTNQEAARLAEEGAADGTVVLADAQTKGKGRLGRQWASPSGVNLYCSVILRPAILPPAATQLTLLSAVAVARTIAACTPLVSRIKWPNDLLIAGRKVAGLLNEMSAETDRVNYVILGIGVNLNMTADQFPPDLRSPATSLLLAGGGRVDRTIFAQKLLQELDFLYDLYLREGDDPIRELWLGLSDMAGKRVSVDYGSTQPPLIGQVTGVDSMGALLVCRADGSVERVLAGDVKLLEEDEGAAGY